MNPAKMLALPDALLPCADSGGTGTPVLFLHGAVTDLRMWEPHRALLRDGFRAIAYSQRYHGAGAWQADWPPYGAQTHADDLVAAVQALQAGPVHLVAWSYGGHPALLAALHRPHLFRSLFVYEPGVPSYVEDAQALVAWQADAQAAFGPVFEAASKGDVDLALRRLLEASSQQPGYFERQPAEAQAIQRENARTLAELLFRQPPAPAISAPQLAGFPVPLCVACGAASRPLYSLVSAAAQRCLPAQRRLVVPGANHMWPQEDPAAFMQAVRRFIASVA